VLVRRSHYCLPRHYKKRKRRHCQYRSIAGISSQCDNNIPVGIPAPRLLILLPLWGRDPALDGEGDTIGTGHSKTGSVTSNLSIESAVNDPASGLAIPKRVPRPKPRSQTTYLSSVASLKCVKKKSCVSDVILYYYCLFLSPGEGYITQGDKQGTKKIAVGCIAGRSRGAEAHTPRLASRLSQVNTIKTYLASSGCALSVEKNTVITD
jgi:hypothetical protein